jgi:hypothetical protein
MKLSLCCNDPLPLQTHLPSCRFSTASESLDDLKRKLDVEHTSISSKLEQGAAARQELQDLKGAILVCSRRCASRLPASTGKIMEDLELSKSSVAKRLEKIENKA